jgi:hypothetical protein
MQAAISEGSAGISNRDGFRADRDTGMQSPSRAVREPFLLEAGDMTRDDATLREKSPVLPFVRRPSKLGVAVA